MSDIFDLFKKIEKKETPFVGPPVWVIAGLGNPGREYAETRHNAGFCALDAFADAISATGDWSFRFNARVKDATVDGVHVLLVKPETYMNASGESVASASRFYKIAPDHVIVLSDDISLEPGRIRVREKGSAGGHNGLKSIIEYLSTETFFRIKIGVGAKPTPDYDLADWVLGKIPPADRVKTVSVYPYITEGIRKIIAGDTEGAKQLCNGVRGDKI